MARLGASKEGRPVPQIDRVLRSNLKLRHLQLLVALDQFRHLGRAAQFLAQTQPAVSKSLAEIERMLGLSLFLRSTRGTEPTPVGEAVVRFARSVLADFARTRDEIEALARGAAGRVAIGAMAVAMPRLVVGAVERLKAHSAQTSVFIEEGDLTRLLPRLRVGELDLFVGRLEPGYAAPDLETEALYDETMSIVVRPDHPLAARRRPGWDELARQPWVLPPPWASSRVKLLQLFHSHGEEGPTDIVESASWQVTVTFVRQRAAVAFVASDVARQLADEGLAVALTVPVPIDLPPVGIMTLRRRHRTAACALLIDCLRETAAARRTLAAARRKPQRRRLPRP